MAFSKIDGIGGDAGEPILVDQLLEAALGDEAAGEEIEPDGLAMIMQALERVRDGFVLPCTFITSSF